MKELLDRLKQIDPTTYKRFDEETIATRWIYTPDGGEDVESYGCNLSEAAQMAWLQACLQTAIRSRGGWYWKMSSQPLDGTGKYVCEIVKESGWKTVWVREEGNSPAEAMLATYIEAMS